MKVADRKVIRIQCALVETREVERIVDFIGRQQGAKPRDILFHDLPSLEAKMQDLGLF